jgi:LAO/AO transport system kinase
VRHHGQLLQVNSPPRTHDEQVWLVQVLKTIASTDEGVAELVAQLDEHREWLLSSGEWAVRERLRAAHTLESILRAELTRRIVARMPTSGLDDLVEAIRRRETDPYRAATSLIAGW